MNPPVFKTLLVLHVIYLVNTFQPCSLETFFLIEALKLCHFRKRIFYVVTFEVKIKKSLISLKMF